MKPYLLLFSAIFVLAEVDYEPTKCEACLIVAQDWSMALGKLHKKTGSEFLEATESLCNSMNEYKIHKEKTGISRFSKKQSKTIETLRQLRDKGVQVKLDLPFELWENPTAEIVKLKNDCDRILENYEDDVENWFVKNKPESLTSFLCERRVLKRNERDCLPSKQEL